MALKTRALHNRLEKERRLHRKQINCLAEKKLLKRIILQAILDIDPHRVGTVSPTHKHTARQYIASEEFAEHCMAVGWHAEVLRRRINNGDYLDRRGKGYSPKRTS